jgi:hypothetical protein
MRTHKSYSDDQNDIIEAIMDINGIDRFDIDLTYGNGNFYKNFPEPLIKIDIDPQQPDVIEASSVEVPLPNGCVSSVMFDPPFLTYIKSGRDHNSIMGKRFAGYWRYDELEDHYRGTLKEAARLLCREGVMVIKCQDIIHNHTMHPTHINITQWMLPWFRLKDLFILTAKHRMPMPEKEGDAKRKQKHARVHHSYFMVLERNAHTV